MNRKTSIIVSITGIVIIILALLGLTYGYYITKITGNETAKSVEVITGDSSVRFTDLSEENISAIIEPGYTLTKSFTVENTGNISATYSIYFVDVYNDFVRTEDITYTLYRIDNNSTFPTNYEGCIENPADEKACKIVVNNAEFPTSVALIKANETITTPEDVFKYDLVITYINHSTINQNVDQGHTFKGSVNLRASMDDLDNPFSEGTLAYNIINNAKLNKNGTRFVNTPPSKVAEQVSSNNWDLGVEENIYYDDEYVVGYAESEDILWSCYVVGENCDAVTEYTSCTNDVKGKYVFDDDYRGTQYVTDCENGKIVSEKAKYEKVLTTTQDDYGTSYYYRGNVEDNYVNFAGMCWRIVRIAGDGTTKLILEDQYTTCDDTETETTSAVYTGNWKIGTGNYGYELKNVDADSSNEYIMNYLKPVASNTSSMVKAFYDFQTSKLADYTGKLKAGDWCLGDKAYTRSESSGSYTYTLLEEYNYSSNMYYDSNTRLTGENANGYQPTLKCNGSVLNEFADVSGVSSKAPMYVSAITADEIVYAGGKYGSTNYNYYLINNYQKSNHAYFWSLSP